MNRNREEKVCYDVLFLLLLDVVKSKQTTNNKQVEIKNRASKKK